MEKKLIDAHYISISFYPSNALASDECQAHPSERNLFIRVSSFSSSSSCVRSPTCRTTFPLCVRITMPEFNHSLAVHFPTQPSRVCLSPSLTSSKGEHRRRELSSVSSSRTMVQPTILPLLLLLATAAATARAAVAADAQMPMPMAVAALQHVHLKGDKCKNDSALFVAELHKLTLWAVQSRIFTLF